MTDSPLTNLGPLMVAGLLVALIMLVSPAPAKATEKDPALKPEIVLAIFGTTEPEALSAILNVEKRVKAAFPEYKVHLSFTADRIRAVWRERARDAAWKAKNHGIPAELYSIANPLAVLAKIQDQGPRPVFVQSLHIVNGTEFDNQKLMTQSLAALSARPANKKPFPYISLGDSALGKGSAKELERAAEALKPLVEEARSKDAALVLFGHGNHEVDIPAYRNLAAHMVKKYAPQPVFMALVDGKPGVDDLLATVKKAKVEKAFLAPLMLVAGDHAINDMAGDESDSLASMLKEEGIKVESWLKGLGDNNSWADIYVERLRAQVQAYEKTAP